MSVKLTPRSERGEKGPGSKTGKPVPADKRSLLKDLSGLPGNQIVNRIIQQRHPGKLVQELSQEDFFWLVKKVGEADCLPLLELASEQQWQYLLDLEIWTKDRLQVEKSAEWLGRLQEADSKRLVRWLFTEGQSLAYYQLFRSIEVVLRKRDEVIDLPDGFFTLDGVFYIRALEPTRRNTIETLLRTMASEDLDRYQALLLGLSGVLPAELEEEMYRLRKVRLAEHGFLPFEEALEVYAPLAPDSVYIEVPPQALSDLRPDEEVRDMVPVLPLYHAGPDHMLAKAVGDVGDPAFLDRINMEFAGLCNQVLSADGLMVREMRVLLKTCRKTAGYLNLGLERLCGTDLGSAQKCLKYNSLLSIFRVGFGLTLKLRWKVEEWIRRSWFLSLGLMPEFWGEEWGGILSGILQKRPLLYAAFTDGEEYKNFERLSELDACRHVLYRLMALDGLLERLTCHYPADKEFVVSRGMTCRPLIFNIWARRVLKLEPGFSGISLNQAKQFFLHIRAGRQDPPYDISNFYTDFIDYFMAVVPDLDPETTSLLKDSLSLLWHEFCREYEGVSLDDLDGRYSRFISIIPHK